MDNIVSTISAITITLSAILSPTLAPVAPVVNEASQEAFVDYVVRPGDSLQTIALEKLKDADHWTTIWNDNETIKDPDLIEKGDKIRIAVEKPEKPEKLNENLAATLSAKSVASKAVAPVSPTPAAQVKAIPAEEPAVSPAPEAKPTVVSSPASLNDAQLTFLGNCESGMTAARNSGNGYYGAFQFSIGTWNSMGTSYERADLAPLEVQKDAVQRLLARSSISTQFPGCASKMRSLGLL